MPPLHKHDMYIDSVLESVRQATERDVVREVWNAAMRKRWKRTALLATAAFFAALLLATIYEVASRPSPCMFAPTGNAEVRR